MSERVSAREPKRLIVNADDFGRSVGINDGVLAAASRGIVTSATAMVNYPAAEDAARRLSDATSPKLGVGLHLQFSGGALAQSREEAPSLYSADGRAPASPEGHGELDPDDVAREVAAQLERFRALFDRDPTHFDGHHHAHALPEVFDVVVGWARDLGVPVRSVDAPMTARLAAEGIATTRPLIRSFYDEGATEEELDRILDGVPAGWSELMCHPGVVDETLAGSSSYTSMRERELELLTRPEVVRRVGELGIELVDFQALTAESRGG